MDMRLLKEDIVRAVNHHAAAFRGPASLEYVLHHVVDMVNPSRSFFLSDAIDDLIAERRIARVGRGYIPSEFLSCSL